MDPTPRKRVQIQHVLILTALLGLLVTLSSWSDATALPSTLERPKVEDPSVYVNEFLVSSRTSLVDEDGDLSDWIEIYNSGAEPRRLEGYWLSDKPDGPFKWQFPQVIMGPGDYLVVFASGKDRRDPTGRLHTNFRLNDENDSVVFSNKEGHVIDDTKIVAMVTDVSYGRTEGDRDVWLYFPEPTPGEANYTRGVPELSDLPLGLGLRVNEVAAFNDGTLADEDRDYPDWIEIINSGEESVDLAGFGLSDDPDDPYRWEFPELTLAPGEFAVVFASGKDHRDPDGSNLHTNFKIGVSGETVVLSNPWDQVVDTLDTGKLSPGASSGKNPDGGEDRFFFLMPSPGGPNAEPALAGCAPQPRFSQRGGFFDSAQSLSMVVEAPPPGAVIRYTLDGAEPSESSRLYSGPISIEKTSVVRARTFAPGRLPSPTTNQSYFINDRPTLTVVSIMIDPADFTDPREGIYVLGDHASTVFPYRGANFWQDIEKPIHLQLFEPDGTLGCGYDLGIQIGGQYSRAMPQKTFNVFARDRYGYDVMEYPFFPGLDQTTFKAITLRTSGQDAALSKMRDIMLTSLLEETSLDYQHYRLAVVYINGGYWGLYEIRERANEYFVAYRHGADPEKIDLLQADWTVRAGSADNYLALREYVSENDPRDQENYEFVKTWVDIDNYIDYLIAEMYFANTDTANVRFWRERTDGAKWRWIVYDLDWAFFLLHHNTVASMCDPEGTGYAQQLSTLLTRRLVENEEFRRQFIQRFAYHLNYTFTPERVIARIDEIVAVLEPEMPRHLERWGGSMSMWRFHVQMLRDYAEERPAIVLGHIQRKFGLSDEEMRIFEGD